jgi:hypothetical protein
MSALLEVLRFVVLTYGLVYFVTDSVIFLPVRQTLGRHSVWLRAFLYCPMCTATWIGFGLHGLGIYPFANSNGAIIEDLFDVIEAGLFAMGATALVAHRLSYPTTLGIEQGLYDPEKTEKTNG